MILETLRCDRCRETCHEPDRTTWARLYAATLSGSDIVGTSETPADLCAACAIALKAWFGVSSEDTSARVKIELGDKVVVGDAPGVVASASWAEALQELERIEAQMPEELLIATQGLLSELPDDDDPHLLDARRKTAEFDAVRGELFSNEPLCPDGDPDWMKS